MSKLDILCRKFDLLWAEIEEAGLDNEFLKYLEQMDLYDYERARQLVIEEGRR